MVLFEVICLMMMFGSGASTYATTFKDVSRFNEVTATTVPAGTPRTDRRPEVR
jgi:hypothetical protein